MDELHRQGRDRAPKLTREEAEAVALVLPYATEALQKKQGRNQRRVYDYHSGSYYQEPVVEEMEGHAQPVRVGKLRAARASTINLLPTATMLVCNERKPVKIDTGAQYSVAGQDWSRYGTKLDTVAPVDYMEGFSGVAVKVLGVWRSDFLTQYQQHMQVDALLVASDTPDFLVGEDWMYAQGVKIDFLASEMKLYADDEKIVAPFTGIGTATAHDTGTAKVRLLRQAKVRVFVLLAGDVGVGLHARRALHHPQLPVLALLLAVISSSQLFPLVRQPLRPRSCSSSSSFVPTIAGPCSALILVFLIQVARVVRRGPIRSLRVSRLVDCSAETSSPWSGLVFWAAKSDAFSRHSRAKCPVFQQ
ncbi:hypothetical protein PR001_g9064 [Phytophthora rubi]|nr:hypothetical protein PR001_g9064 [Phytophthora rubi]